MNLMSTGTIDGLLLMPRVLNITADRDHLSGDFRILSDGESLLNMRNVILGESNDVVSLNQV